jgi:hypothetical protein
MLFLRAYLLNRSLFLIYNYISSHKNQTIDRIVYITDRLAQINEQILGLNHQTADYLEQLSNLSVPLAQRLIPEWRKYSKEYN